jgi:hypothetical protein
MKYAVETASGGMIYIPGFMTIGSVIQVLLQGPECTQGSCKEVKAVER